MTRPPLALRRRVALASAGLGLALCGLFVGAVILLTEDYEAVLSREILRGQAEDYALRAASGLPAALPQTQRLSGYRDHPPPAYAAFPPGIHEDPGDDGRHVGVFDTEVGRLYFVIDLSDIERLELHLDAWLVAFVTAGVALSGMLGWWLAGRALLPLGRLAHAVDALDVVPARTDLAASAPPDELGRLARAIDDYQARLVATDERERAFFADASHELRTPVAVVRGVSEVLLDDPDLAMEQGHRLQRLERGVHELGDLIEALLSVARRRPVELLPTDLAHLARQALHECGLPQALLAADADQDAIALVSPSESALLLRMLLRRQDLSVPGSRIGVAANALHIEAGEATDAASRGANPALQPRTISTLTARLALRAGWELRSTPRGFSLVAIRSETPG